MKQVKLSTPHYQMLVELARKKHKQPTEYIEALLQSAYNGSLRDFR